MATNTQTHGKDSNRGSGTRESRSTLKNDGRKGEDQETRQGAAQDRSGNFRDDPGLASEAGRKGGKASHGASVNRSERDSGHDGRAMASAADEEANEDLDETEEDLDRADEQGESEMRSSDRTATKGGNREQHAEAGRQSHKH